jgi:ribonuclease HI
MEALARALHDAEETRDQAIAYLQSRETELTGQLSQTEAELRAAMEGLREARAETKSCAAISSNSTSRRRDYQRESASSSSDRAATQVAPSVVTSFFQNGARDLR